MHLGHSLSECIVHKSCWYFFWIFPMDAALCGKGKNWAMNWAQKAAVKSVNLQLGCLDDGTNESSTKRLMFQVLYFFMISCRILCKNTFNLFVYFFKKNTKIKVKSFECPKSIKSLKKIILGTSDAWSTIRLSNRPSETAWIYLRLTDFWSLLC